MPTTPDRNAVPEAGTDLPTSPEAVFARLDALSIAHRTFNHPPVYTVEQAKALRGEIAGAHIKNLFLRDKKKRMWLVVALEHRRIDLKRLAGRLGARGLSFASAERLMTYLGVEPGSVTPLAVLNDAGGAVTVILDSAVLDYPLVNCHPLVNHMTTALAPDDLLRFLASVDHEPGLMDFSEP
jgi:Ala-tRNA(Pro) deacylase